MPDPSTVLYINPVSWVGGAEGAMLDLVTNIDRSRFTPVVVCPSDGEFVDMLRKAGIPTHIVPFYGLRARNPVRYFETIFKLRSLIKRYKARLVHVNQQYASNYGVIAAKLCRLPCIVHLRGVEGDKFFDRFLRWIARADQIICVSNAVRCRLLEYLQSRVDARRARLIEQKASVVYDGIKYEAALRPEEARNRLGLALDCQAVGIVGQVIPEKGIKEFVEAARIVADEKPNTVFAVVGEDPKPRRDFASEMAFYAERLGLGSNIRFYGFRRDAAQLTRAFDVTVLASWQEAFGRVVLESLAAGVPVVATRVGGVPEIVEDGVCGILVPPRNPESLAEGILAVLNMPQDKYFQMSENARRRAANFSIGRHVQEVQRLYDELLT
jgi:glycosyltransferase involved in cell wall biosynthesis